MATKNNKKEPGATRRARPRTRPQAKRLPTEEEIRNRAYELYLARGGEGGHEREDWEQAERELTNPE